MLLSRPSSRVSLRRSLRGLGGEGGLGALRGAMTAKEIQRAKLEQASSRPRTTICDCEPCLILKKEKQSVSESNSESESESEGEGEGESESDSLS